MMKHTMNSRDVSKFHKLLLQDVSKQKISEYMQISVETLGKFTPDKMALAKDRRQDSENYESKQLKKKQTKPLTLTKEQAE